MTDQTLADLLRHAPDDLDPATADRILGAAMVSGTRRRRGRQLAVTGAALSTAAVVALAVSASGLVGTDGGPQGPAVAGSPDLPAATTSPPAPPVPGEDGTRGPVIPTDRAIADDAALRTVATELLAGAGELSGLAVGADPTAPRARGGAGGDNGAAGLGRQLDFLLDGGAASVTLQRWDGIAAVGTTLAVDPTGPAHEKIATTAAEACAGAYLTYPAIECRESPAGWYSVARPSQGDAMPDEFQELALALYTPDGYAVRVTSYNTPGEKVGPAVADQPVLTEAESLALASSQRWFVPR